MEVLIKLKEALAKEGKFFISTFWKFYACFWKFFSSTQSFMHACNLFNVYSLLKKKKRKRGEEKQVFKVYKIDRNTLHLFDF